MSEQGSLFQAAEAEGVDQHPKDVLELIAIGLVAAECIGEQFEVWLEPLFEYALDEGAVLFALRGDHEHEAHEARVPLARPEVEHGLRGVARDVFAALRTATPEREETYARGGPVRHRIPRPGVRVLKTTRGLAERRVIRRALMLARLIATKRNFVRQSAARKSWLSALNLQSRSRAERLSPGARAN